MPDRYNSLRLELTGIAASAGTASGPLWIPDDTSLLKYLPKTNADLEAEALDLAITNACQDISALMSNAIGAAIYILEFQIEALNDYTFRDACLLRITAGENAYEAWDEVLKTEIDSFLQANDNVFKARALDLQDIKTRVAHILCEHVAQEIPAGVIVFADTIKPTEFIKHWRNYSGIALQNGSTSSHLAILARQFSLPMLTNIELSDNLLVAGEQALIEVDANTGRLIIRPDIDDDKALFRERNIRKSEGHQMRPLTFRNGKSVSIMVNLADLHELDTIDLGLIDGIGLVRTEFLFAGEMPDEQTQFQAYCRILKWAEDKPVFIRTFDAGGDKPMSGGASGSRFKLRGIRLSLFMPEIFRVQIRALLRAATHGNLHVTLPMVATETDLDEALELFESEAAKFSAAGISHSMPPVGIMIEVPAVATTLDRFNNAAHFSIGTNDLIQYTLAEPRDAAGKKSGVDNPAIMSLIKNTVAVGRTLEKLVSVCGEAASDPTSVAHLLSAGISCFSVNPPSVELIMNAAHTYNAAQEA